MVVLNDVLREHFKCKTKLGPVNIDLTIHVNGTECVIVRDTIRMSPPHRIHIRDEDIRKLLGERTFKYRIQYPLSEDEQWFAYKHVKHTEIVQSFARFLAECMGLNDKNNKQHNCT